ncbi:hypothetical protein ACIQGZ_18020 [Streptomyces sp. NPDC092296]|uniref:SCO2583 family membrane protein n=1 Tax=Streptomyces sp. NPDC092296 TaxID=3366012 RepID=UPI0038123FDE
MGDREEPPEGVPEGVPGGDDEFRSVVFDESFVRAARIQEPAASERVGSAGHGVRRRVGRPFVTLPRQAFALMLLIAMAFAAAVYLGIRHPYREPEADGSRLTANIVPLAPASGTAAPAPDSGDPFAQLERVPGAAFYDGSVGLTPPVATATRHFSDDQVSRALAAVQQYLVASSLDSKVLVEGSTGAVRDLLSPGQQAQFDAAVSDPRDDQHHEATGWLVRFDPAQVTLAVSRVKVAGGMTFGESDDRTLEVLTDHTFVYALQAAPHDGRTSADTVTGTPTAGPEPTWSATASPTPAIPAGAPGPTVPAGPLGPGSVSPGASPGSASPDPEEALPDQRSVPGEPVTLFTVRRELRFRFDRADISDARVELVDSVLQAGPMACDAHAEQYLRPVLADRPAPGATRSPHARGSATAPPPLGSTQAGIDPLDRLHRPAWQVCGVLSGPMANLPTGSTG